MAIIRDEYSNIFNIDDNLLPRMEDVREFAERVDRCSREIDNIVYNRVRDLHNNGDSTSYNSRCEFGNFILGATAPLYLLLSEKISEEEIRALNRRYINEVCINFERDVVGVINSDELNLLMNTMSDFVLSYFEILLNLAGILGNRGTGEDNEVVVEDDSIEILSRSLNERLNQLIAQLERSNRASFLVGVKSSIVATIITALVVFLWGEYIKKYLAALF